MIVIVIVPMIDRLALWYDVHIMIVIVIVPMSDRKQVGLSMSFSRDVFLSISCAQFSHCRNSTVCA